MSPPLPWLNELMHGCLGKFSQTLFYRNILAPSLGLTKRGAWEEESKRDKYFRKILASNLIRSQQGRDMGKRERVRDNPSNDKRRLASNRRRSQHSLLPYKNKAIKEKKNKTSMLENISLRRTYIYIYIYQTDHAWRICSLNTLSLQGLLAY